jgi:hypothetical protein
MLFSMMLTLAVASSALEITLAARIKPWRMLCAKYSSANMIMSLLLSFVIGIAFGAQGLIAMGAGVISTILSYPGYKFLHWNYDSPQALAQGGNRVAFYWAQWKQVLVDFGNLLYKILRIITIPIRFVRWINTKFSSLKNRKIHVAQANNP